MSLSNEYSPMDFKTKVDRTRVNSTDYCATMVDYMPTRNNVVVKAVFEISSVELATATEEKVLRKPPIHIEVMGLGGEVLDKGVRLGDSVDLDFNGMIKQLSFKSNQKSLANTSKNAKVLNDKVLLVEYFIMPFITIRGVVNSNTFKYNA